MDLHSLSKTDDIEPGEQGWGEFNQASPERPPNTAPHFLGPLSLHYSFLCSWPSE